MAEELSSSCSLENFLDVTSNISEGCRKRFLKTNKKTNYITRQKTIKYN